MSSNRPVVLSFSGHDPSGGAGIQADIETLISHQCHSISIITALTEQDSCNVKKIIPQQPQDILSQANTLFEDFNIACIKIGLLGSKEIIPVIRSILLRYPDIPVVLDPILAAGGGKPLSTPELTATIYEQLIPLCTVITPNASEARKLCQSEDLTLCGQSLLNQGAQFILITGADEKTEQIENQLFSNNQNESFFWERLPHSYHGSGCTLASAIAALISHGLDPFTAISEAQEYTWNSLASGYRGGKGQMNPNRLFWMET